MELVAVDPKSRRDRRICGDGLSLVCVHRDQNFLIDEKARPGYKRAHPVAQAARQTKVDTVPGDVMQHLPAPSQRQRLLAEIHERSQGFIKFSVFIEEVTALSTQATEPAAEHVF